MDDKINNKIDSFRVRLAVLNKPENLMVWQNRPPLKFKKTAAEVTIALQALEDSAGKQSSPITGHAADKRREEKELEDIAFALGRALVNYADHRNNLTIAAKYDVPISGWRRLRDEALLDKARQLHIDANNFVNGPDAAEAADYGLTPATLTELKNETDDYADAIASPTHAIANRRLLTGSLRDQVRALDRQFDLMDDLVLQFRGDPGSDAFVKEWLLSAQIIDRGDGKAPAGEEEEPPPNPHTDPTPPLI